MHYVGTGHPDGPEFEEHDMARKRGEYQKRKERKIRNGMIYALVLFVVFILIFVYGIVDSKYTIQQIDNGALMEYTGRYSYEYRNERRIFSHGRDSYYRITLDNGVTFILSEGSRYCEILDENPVIYVQYFQDPFRNLYDAVSVASADGTVTMKSLESYRKSNVSIIRTLPIVIVICSLFCVFFLMLLFEKQIKRFLRWRKKRRKMRKQIDASK